LEDINNLLNTGEIANLYDADDYTKMADSLERYMRLNGSPTTKDNIYQTYLDRLRDNFCVILCMSPVGDQLR